MRWSVKIKKYYKALLAVICMLLLVSTAAMAKSKYVCDEPDPASLCTAANTCGSASAPCPLGTTQSGNSSHVQPGAPNAKNNQLFCIKKGTAVVWMTSNKNTGFMISFGTDSPFDTDDPRCVGPQHTAPPHRARTGHRSVTGVVPLPFAQPIQTSLRGPQGSQFADPASRLHLSTRWCRRFAH